MSDTSERVKKIVVEHLGIDESKVNDSASFIDDLGADSLDTVELVMAFEEEFEIEIPDDAAEKIQTIKDAIEDEMNLDNYGVCGGCCACGTCHIYVHPNDFDKLINKEDEEILTLESLANDPNQYSRLSCQIIFKKEYENITFTIAPD